MLPALLSSVPVTPMPSQEIFFQYGPVGVIAGLGIWFFFRVYNREAQRADRAEQTARELLEKVIPLMTDANRVLGDATAILKERGHQ